MISVEKCVLEERKRLTEYIRAKEKPMLKELRRENILSEEETKKWREEIMHDDRIKGFTEKSLHGKFRKSSEAIAVEKS